MKSANPSLFNSASNPVFTSQSHHQFLVFQPAGANNLPDLRRSTTRNNVKKQPGDSDESLLKLYFFFTGSGFF
jgi:hypothetical protein